MMRFLLYLLDIRQLLKTDLVSVDEGAEEESELVQDVVVVGGEDDASHVLAGDQHPVEAADLVSCLLSCQTEIRRTHGKNLNICMFEHITFFC